MAERASSPQQRFRWSWVACLSHLTWRWDQLAPPWKVGVVANSCCLNQTRQPGHLCRIASRDLLLDVHLPLLMMLLECDFSHFLCESKIASLLKPSTKRGPQTTTTRKTVVAKFSNPHDWNTKLNQKSCIRVKCRVGSRKACFFELRAPEEKLVELSTIRCDGSPIQVVFDWDRDKTSKYDGESQCGLMVVTEWKKCHEYDETASKASNHDADVMTGTCRWICFYHD